MEKKKEFWPEMARPFVVLTVICLLVAALLGLTNSRTKPIIEENARIEAENTRRAALPAASSFEEIDVTEELAALGVTGIFKGDGDSGYVVTAANKGYGGDVTVTVGLDGEGKIVNAIADVSGETQGVGSKVGGMMDRFFGLSDGAEGVDLKTGATFTSKAVRASVTAAFEAFAYASEN